MNFHLWQIVAFHSFCLPARSRLQSVVAPKKKKKTALACSGALAAGCVCLLSIPFVISAFVSWCTIERRSHGNCFGAAGKCLSAQR